MFAPLQFNKGNLQRLIVNVTGVVNTWSGGTTGLTPAGASSGNVVLGGVLNVANGGTGVTTSTGTGSVVLNMSAQLVTPDIGVATGTSASLTGFALIGRGLNPTVGGSTSIVYQYFNATAIGVYTGTGSPTISTARGSLYLRNDGLPYYNTNGTTGWSPIAGFTQTKVTVFTNSGTWFVDPRTLAAQMECWGGGGAGGSTATAAAATSASGGGGGAGSYSRTTSLKATIGTSQTITIGAAGTPGSAGNNPGGNGGDTSVASLCIGKAGSGGPGSDGSTTRSAGGAGGVAGTGDVTTVGQAGSNAAQMTTIAPVGYGGSSSVGGGGNTIVGATAATGGAATGRAAGGGGGQSFNAGGTAAGGAGTAGYVVITEYLAT